MSSMAVDIFARTVALASLNGSEGSYTKAEIDKMFGEAGTVQVEAVDVLPIENIRENVIYLVPNGSSGENYYDECMYINGKWEIIGNTKIDLSNYYTKDEVDNKSIVNIALPKSTFEGSSGNIRQEDYQAFLPLLQFLYTKCKGTSGDRFIRLPLVNINTAHDSSNWLDLDNGQLFIVNEQYNKSLNNIHVSLDGIPKFDESGVAKYFSLYVDGNIENDNITSIRSVSIHKSTLPVATKKYVDDSRPIIYLNAETSDIFKKEVNTKLLPYISDPSVDLTKYLVYLYGPFTAQFDTQMKYIYGTLMEISSLTQTKVTLKELVQDISYSNGDTSSKMSCSNTFINIGFKDGKATSISSFSSGKYCPNILATGINYSSPYMPEYDGSPATKKYVDDVVEKDAIILEVYVPDRTNVTLNTQENRDKLNIWFNDILNKGYHRPLYIKSNATGGNLKEGFLSNRHLYRVLMANGFPLEGKPTEFKFYCLPTFNSISVSVLFGVQYRSTEQLETRAILSWNDDGSLSVTSVEWTGSKVYLPINTGTSGNSSKHLPLGVGNTTAYTPTGDYNPATKKYVDDALANIDVSFDDVYVVTCGHRFDGGSYNITDDGSITEMMNTYWPKYLANSNQGGLVIWKDYTGATNGTTLIGYMRGTEIYIQWPWNSQNNGLVNNPYGSVGVVTITGSWDSSTETYTLTKAVWNRINYVPTKDWNPANKKYVDKSIKTAIAGVSQFSLLPVDVLPTEDIKTNVIYAVPSDNPKEKDVRIEYVYINDSWEILGNTKIDLSNTVIDGGTF